VSWGLPGSGGPASGRGGGAPAGCGVETTRLLGVVVVTAVCARILRWDAAPPDEPRWLLVGGLLLLAALAAGKPHAPDDRR
jgi:hypothetical protein